MAHFLQQGHDKRHRFANKTLESIPEYGSNNMPASTTCLQLDSDSNLEGANQRSSDANLNILANKLFSGDADQLSSLERFEHHHDSVLNSIRGSQPVHAQPREIQTHHFGSGGSPCCQQSLVSAAQLAEDQQNLITISASSSNNQTDANQRDFISQLPEMMSSGVSASAIVSDLLNKPNQREQSNQRMLRTPSEQYSSFGPIGSKKSINKLSSDKQFTSSSNNSSQEIGLPKQNLIKCFQYEKPEPLFIIEKVDKEKYLKMKQRAEKRRQTAEAKKQLQSKQKLIGGVLVSYEQSSSLTWNKNGQSITGQYCSTQISSSLATNQQSRNSGNMHQQLFDMDECTINNMNSTHAAFLGNYGLAPTYLYGKPLREVYRYHKSLLFRTKRRQYRLQMAKSISKVKNKNRQKAALKRQRDAGGKFLDKRVGK